MVTPREKSSEKEADFNKSVAESQRQKTAFRAQKTALSADKFNPARIASYPKPIDV